MHLNTLYVDIKRGIISSRTLLNNHLNTLYVDIKLGYMLIILVGFADLNTLYVDIKRNNISPFSQCLNI